MFWERIIISVNDIPSKDLGTQRFLCDIITAAASTRLGAYLGYV